MPKRKQQRKKVSKLEYRRQKQLHTYVQMVREFVVMRDEDRRLRFLHSLLQRKLVKRPLAVVC